MSHKCKICGKLDDRSTCFGKRGWHHAKRVFEAWQAALKELTELRATRKQSPMLEYGGVFIS